MKVIYFNRAYIGSIDFPARPAQSIGHVMRESDIVSIHLPGDKGNHGLINEEQISLMKDSSFFINTSNCPKWNLVTSVWPENLPIRRSRRAEKNGTLQISPFPLFPMKKRVQRFDVLNILDY